MKDESNTTPWHLVGVAAAVCVGLSVAAYAVGVKPMLERRQHEFEQTKALRERSETAEQLTSSVADLQRQLGEARDALARSPVRLQPATLVNQRLEALTRLASECGVAIDEVRPGAPVDATHYQTVPIRIVGNGHYPACTNFLRKLRMTFGDMGVRTFNATAGTISASRDAQWEMASFQAELIWFTELPHK